MKTLLKMQENKRTQNRGGATFRIDQALISKFESGTRKPTREQVVKLTTLLDIDLETIMVAWLKKNSLRNRSR
jgi:ribosome-binding protein aMBF1 (putative translation factor)